VLLQHDGLVWRMAPPPIHTHPRSSFLHHSLMCFLFIDDVCTLEVFLFACCVAVVEKCNGVAPSHSAICPTTAPTKSLITVISLMSIYCRILLYAHALQIIPQGLLKVLITSLIGLHPKHLGSKRLIVYQMREMRPSRLRPSKLL